MLLRIKMELIGPPGSFKTTMIQSVVKELQGLPPGVDYFAEFWTTTKSPKLQMETMTVKVGDTISRPSWPTEAAIAAARRMIDGRS